jgi:hypothetical protein
MHTSWAHGPAGPTGLRYEAMPFFLDLNDVPRAEWRDVTFGVRVMEQETLRVWGSRS